MLHRCKQGALAPCRNKVFPTRGLVTKHYRLLRQPCRPGASKQDSQKDGDGKHASSREPHRTEAELWGMQKDMMYSQIHCINQEREAWLASQTALLAEIRELQRLHRDTVAGAYEAFLGQERSYWAQQREEWEKKEAALQGQLAALKASVQQPGGSSGVTAASWQAAAGALPASAQVADVLRQVAPASTAAGQAPSTPTPASWTAPAPTAAPVATATPVTAAAMPSFAADLAAAIAAVEHVDVLHDAQLSQFMTRHAAAPPTTPTHNPASPPAPAGTAEPEAPGTPVEKDKKGPLAGGPWGGAGGGGGLDSAGQPRRVVEATPIETVRAPQNGPPPMLRWGDNDIYWVGRLHAALASHGFYTSDEEEADFLFGDSTQEAVAFFQASVSLPETGVATVETWEKLLQGTPEEFPLIGGSAPHVNEGDHGKEGSPSSWHEDADEAAWGRVGAQAAAAAAASSKGSREQGAASSAGLGTNGSSSSSSGDGGKNGRATAGVADAGAAASAAAGAAAVAPGTSTAGSSSSGDIGGEAERTAWPVVRDGDGGREVHALQVLLSQRGYRCCDDERQWWQCGSSTVEAVLYFQACAGLPESGVCAEHTWRQLLATAEDPDGQAASPAAIDAVRDGEYDDDLTEMQGGVTGRVYLLGEERWSR